MLQRMLDFKNFSTSLGATLQRYFSERLWYSVNYAPFLYYILFPNNLRFGLTVIFRLKINEHY